MTILAHNPAWTGPKPEFKEIHFYPIDEEKTAEISFEAGDIDFTRISVSSLEKFQTNLLKHGYQVAAVSRHSSIEKLDEFNDCNGFRSYYGHKNDMLFL